jgi:hypothetical protein
VAFGVIDPVFEFLEAERRVAECKALIKCQRLLIEGLACEGRDITSAKIVLVSLHISLYLHMQDRHRLRALNGELADVSEAGLAGVNKQKHVA